MIEIVITRLKDGREAMAVKQFRDHAEAASWLVQDSYFQNHDVVRVTWQRRECEHDWKFLDIAERELQGFRCRHCGVEFSMVEGFIDELYRRAQ